MKEMSVGPLLSVVFVLTHLVLVVNSAEEERHSTTPNCKPFQCGKLGVIHYPYEDVKQPGQCGLYPVNCSEENNPRIQLKEGGHWYQIFSLPSPHTIFIDDLDLKTTLAFHKCECLEKFGLPSPSNISTLDMPKTVNLLKCNGSLEIAPPGFSYNASCGNYKLYYSIAQNNSLDTETHSSSFPSQCSNIQLPASINDPNVDSLFSCQLTPSFNLEVRGAYACMECKLKEGQCLLVDSKNKSHCSEGKWGKFALKAAIASTCAGLVLILVFLYCLIRKSSAFKSIYMWKKPNQAHQNVEAFLKKYDIPTKRYSYLDVKRMTKSFTDKIGQGGYGCVYKGNLSSGHLVAVKVLSQSKGNGEEFINEVATISKTSHINIVSLLGFCFEGSKRALIYEFMHNGSLEKYIFEQNQNQIENHNYLEWATLYQISLGIARGLEYLHRGCNTRILHFDIKPHNILLDKDFTPKVSDFGLAKVCTREESIISMLDARGTIGYIAPEVFSRNFGGVSHKSDVYSYGMMVLEMVGGRKNVNVQADRTSEIYFPHWIYKRIELDEDLGLKRITNTEDNVKVRKMITMSLWCIQTDPSSRPTMSKVIEMLEGSLDSLKVPPTPFLPSPLRSSTDSSSPLLL